MRRLRYRPDAAASGETVDRTNGHGTGEIVAREWTARKQPSPSRRRFARCVTMGGACIVVATYLPWVMARYEFGWWSWTGMQLTYAHFPPITIGYVSLVLGGTAVWTGLMDGRRPGHAELGIIPAGVTALFLWFIDSSLHAHFGEQISRYSGFSGAWLGLGYWLMMAGTALIFVGAVGVVVADQFSRRSTSIAASSDRNPETLESAGRDVDREQVESSYVSHSPDRGDADLSSRAAAS
jgi:hypothetical protein